MSNISKDAKKAGKTIAFVPTMGYLHDGHLSLVAAAKEIANILVVSIFVNPTQFGPKEDFKKYPRDLSRDEKLLKPFEPLILFHPKAEDMYPEGFKTHVEVMELSQKMCGKSRPGHFNGVTIILAKLFNIIKPDYAFFGEKDFQQLVIVKNLVKDLNLDIEIKSMPIVREFDGLALSSRNSYLSKEERKSAHLLYKALVRGREIILKGEKKPEIIVQVMGRVLSVEPIIKIDYISIVDPETLEDLKEINKENILLALAAYIGKTRLIDNLLVTTN